VILLFLLRNEQFGADGKVIARPPPPLPPKSPRRSRFATSTTDNEPDDDLQDDYDGVVDPAKVQAHRVETLATLEGQQSAPMSAKRQGKQTMRRQSQPLRSNPFIASPLAGPSNYARRYTYDQPLSTPLYEKFRTLRTEQPQDDAKRSKDDDEERLWREHCIKVAELQADKRNLAAFSKRINKGEYRDSRPWYEKQAGCSPELACWASNLCDSAFAASARRGPEGRAFSKIDGELVVVTDEPAAALVLP
jgi:hypothetical protein